MQSLIQSELQGFSRTLAELEWLLLALVLAWTGAPAWIDDALGHIGDSLVPVIMVAVGLLWGVVLWAGVIRPGNTQAKEDTK